MLIARFNETECMNEISMFMNNEYPCLQNLSCNSNDNFYFNVKKNSNKYYVII